MKAVPHVMDITKELRIVVELDCYPRRTLNTAGVVRGRKESHRAKRGPDSRYPRESGDMLRRTDVLS